MLDERLLDAAAAALRPGEGTLTIVSDNAWYAELLLDTLARHGAWAPPPLLPADASAGGAEDAGRRGRRVRRTAGDGLQLVVGAPGAWCGHAAASSSYFDRLWRRGVSKHSAVEERYVLHVVSRG